MLLNRPLKIAHINTENLFLLYTDYKNSSTDTNLPPKDTDKTSELARAILDIDADILCLTEVGGLDSLDLFNEHYLQKKYSPSLIPGNSDRGIELGYLVKKDLPFLVGHLTHKNRVIAKSTNGDDIFFSRDLGELRFFDKSDGKKENPKLIILHSHLKSKWDRTGLDPLGKKQRRFEVEAIIQVYLELGVKYPSTKILVSGDLNGTAAKDICEDEFKAIYEKTKLADLMDALDIPVGERATFVHFERDSGPLPQQIDYIFLPSELIPFIDKENSGIYQYKTKDGNPIPHPQTTFERYALPSDHYPVVLTLKSL